MLLFITIHNVLPLVTGILIGIIIHNMYLSHSKDLEKKIDIIQRNQDYFAEIINDRLSDVEDKLCSNIQILSDIEDSIAEIKEEFDLDEEDFTFNNTKLKSMNTNANKQKG